MDQDHISWKSWKLIAQHVLSSQPICHTPTLRGTWGNIGETREWVGKSGVLEHKSGNISETRRDRERVTNLLWKGYRNSLIPDLPRPPLPQDLGFLTPAQKPKLQSLLSQERMKLRASNLAGTFTGSIRFRTKVH